MSSNASHSTPTRRPRRGGAGSLPPESDLGRLWAAQPTPGAALTTVDGEPVAVLYPGRPGGRSGPDFRDAVVRIGGAPPAVGDVELHREAADFHRHGHAGDPGYDGLVLHVAFSAATHDTTTLASGRAVPLVVLPPVETEARAPRRHEPCATAVSRLGADSAREALREAGLWRLRRKAEAFVAEVAHHGPAQALYAAIAVALGQTANAHGFALLAQACPLDALSAETTGVPEPERAAHYRRRLMHAAGLDGALLAPGPAMPWVTHGLRPAAWPARRVAALADIVGRLTRPTIEAGATSLVDGTLLGDHSTLIRTLTVPAGSGPALCGRTRAVEIAVNALLPWAAAVRLRHGDDATATRILAIAGTLPAAERYGSVRHLHQNLRDGRGRPLLRTALSQQGALALLTEWCRRGGCGRCPLS